MSERKVIFRRFHGRIIPIQVSDNQKKGVGLAAAGTGVAVATGRAAGALLHEAARTENTARDMGRAASTLINPRAKLQQGRLALRTMTKARQLGDASFALRNTGTLIGAALIGAGVHKMLSDTKLKDSPTTQAGVSAGAGIAAHFALRSAYASRLGNKTMAAIKIGARKALFKV